MVILGATPIEESQDVFPDEYGVPWRLDGCPSYAVTVHQFHAQRFQGMANGMICATSPFA